MTRHRRTPMWRRLIQRPAPAPAVEAVTEPVDLDRIVKAALHAVAILDRGVDGTRQLHQPRRPDLAHVDRHGPLLSPDAVVPPPPMAGGAR